MASNDLEEIGQQYVHPEPAQSDSYNHSRAADISESGYFLKLTYVVLLCKSLNLM